MPTVHCPKAVMPFSYELMGCRGAAFVAGEPSCARAPCAAHCRATSEPSMTLHSRRAAIAGLVLLAGVAGKAGAQAAYPHSRVTLVTHSSPGGGSDVFLRELARHLGPVMGVNFTVENVTGGSGARAV